MWAHGQILFYVWGFCNSRYKLGKLHWTSYCTNIQVQIYKTTIPLISHTILIIEHIRHCILGWNHWCQSFKSEKPDMNAWVLFVWPIPFLCTNDVIFVTHNVAMNELRKCLMCTIARYYSRLVAVKIVSLVWKMTLMLKTKQRQFIVKPGNGRIWQNMF